MGTYLFEVDRYLYVFVKEVTVIFYKEKMSLFSKYIFFPIK